MYKRNNLMNRSTTTVKLFASIVLLLSAVWQVRAADGKDLIGQPGPISFNNRKFQLVSSTHPKAFYYTQEYLPAKETLEHFNQKMGIHVFVADNMTVADALKRKTADLERKKQNDPSCDYLVTDSPVGNESVLGFINSERKNNAVTSAEINVFRYKEVMVDGKKALMVYTFTMRSYGTATTPFLKTAKDNRSKYMNELMAASLPVITTKQ
ncbi:MAG: hypothetical protein BGO70_03145 [Bacteroidetes bacterium 43-93]|nr:MAG: hypothetical protein BGO70_03145 [Bacteroidetes bacterium 43-93]